MKNRLTTDEIKVIAKFNDSVNNICPNCGSKDIRPYKGHYCCYECSEFFELNNPTK